MKPIAIIPARGGSKRIAKKNIVDVCGVPMIGHTITNAINSGVFSSIIVSTDDNEIKDISESFGARVVARSEELATDTAFEIDAYAEVLDQIKDAGDEAPEFFCGLYATAIFLEEKDFTGAYELLRGNNETGVLMGVSEYPIHPFKALASNSNGFLEMVHPVECKMRSQTYPKYLASNGTFYWFKTEEYKKTQSYYTDNMSGYILPHERAVDIDNPEDLEWAIKLMKINKGEQ